MKLLSEDIIQFFKNFTALGLVQTTNYLLPLLTLPYLIRVIGIESFGKINIAQAIMLYLIIVCDYGHNLTTTLQISKHRGNNVVISRVVSVTLVTKTLLLLATFLILVAILSLSNLFQGHQKLYLFGFLLVVGQAYFPLWFFQGIENLKYVTAMNFISRSLLTTLIFIVIKEPSQYIYVLPIYGLGGITASIIGLVLMYTKFGLTFTFPSVRNVGNNLKEGFSLFLSSLANNTYLNSGIIILSIYSSETTTGIYAVADKVILIFRQLLVVFAQSVYPTLCRLRFKGEEKLIMTLKNVSIPFGVFILTASLILLIKPDLFSILLTGSSMPPINTLIRITAIIPIIITIGVPIHQLLLAYDFKKQSMLIYLTAALISLISNLPLAYYFEATGIAIGTILIETIIVVRLFTAMKKTGLYNKFSQSNANLH